jgi:hypothetical protein
MGTHSESRRFSRAVLTHNQMEKAPSQSTAVPTTGVQTDMERLAAMPHKSHASIETYINSAPDHLKAIETVGQWIAKSTMFGADRVESGIIVAITCIEKQIGLVEFSRTYDLIPTKNGIRLRKKALAAHAEFEDMGGKVTWLDLGDSGAENAEARVELEYKGQKRVFKFSQEDAKRAGLAGGDKSSGMYARWPSQMLCSRALSDGIARLCPKVYAGCEDQDESAPSLVLPKSEAPLPVKSSEPVKPKAADSGAGSTVVVVPVEKLTPSTVVSAGGNGGDGSMAVVGTAIAVQEPVKEPEKPALTSTLISEELANQVHAALGEHVQKAFDWMLKRKWITQAQIKDPLAPANHFQFLSEDRAKSILAKTSSFLSAVNNPNS